mmetsp:Transcript_33743/g.73735  ORF Transcript_33743/g.73735 Transcript_33743/m.73735 type:complete len:565 (+) Transcript_33743:337-2031(+)
MYTRDDPLAPSVAAGRNPAAVAHNTHLRRRHKLERLRGWGLLLLLHGRGHGGGGGVGERAHLHQLHLEVRPQVLQQHDARRRLLQGGVPHPDALLEAYELLLRGDDARGVVQRLGLQLGRSSGLLALALASVHGLRAALLAARCGAGLALPLRALLLLLRLPLCLQPRLRRRRQHRRRRLGHLGGGVGGDGGGVGEDGGAAVGGDGEGRHLEVRVEPDEHRGGEGQRDEVRQGVPEPVLREHCHADHRRHAVVAGSRPQPQGHVAPSGVEDAGGHDGAHLAHDVLVLVLDEAVELLAEGGHPRLRLLHQHHRHRHQRALAHVVNGVGEQGLEHGHRLHQPGAGAGDAHGHGGAVAHVWVVALAQQRHHTRALLRGLVEHEAEGEHGGAAHVVAHVRDGEVEEAADGAVVGGAAVGEARREHAAVAQDGVRVQAQLLHQRLRLLLAPVRRQRAPHREAADDLLVLGVARVRQQLRRLVAPRARQQQAHADARRLARHRAIAVEDALHVLEDIVVGGAEASQAEAKAGAVLDGLVGGVAQALQQKLPDALAVVHVDKPQRVQRAAL